MPLPAMPMCPLSFSPVCTMSSAAYARCRPKPQWDLKSGCPPHPVGRALARLSIAVPVLPVIFQNRGILCTR